MKNIQKQNTKAEIMPLGDRVLVKPLTEKESEKTASGIFIPESAKKEGKFLKGEVIAVGDGWYQDGDLIPLRVKVGDTILYPSYAGDEIEFNEEKMVIIKEESILAIIK